MPRCAAVYRLNDAILAWQFAVVNTKQTTYHRLVAYTAQP